MKALVFICVWLSFARTCEATTATIPLDSIGIGTYKGNSVLFHRIEGKENYYSIARKYAMQPKKLIAFNQNKALRLGDTLFIQRARLADSLLVSMPKNTSHKVLPGETLYGIAKRYDLTTADLQALNGLKDTKILPGLVLTITRSNSAVSKEATQNPIAMARVAPVIQNASPSPVVVTRQIKKNTEPDIEPYFQNQKAGISGMATWIADADLNNAKSVALFDDLSVAPIGTIIKINSPLTKKSIYVKVVGPLTASKETKGVKIVISQSAATLLGLTDKKFRVNMQYSL